MFQRTFRGSFLFKKSQVPEGIKDWKIMTHFHLMRTQKHKIWSITVLNMAKYTIILLLLIDFVPIFFIFNLFRRIFRGSYRFKKIPSSKKSQVDFRGGVNPFQYSPKFKKVPTPLGRGGVHHHLGRIPKFRCFFEWKASLSNKVV